MEIFTLHFDIKFSSRAEFLRLVYNNIYTLSIRHEREFTDVDVSLFHKSAIHSSEHKHFMPLIHCVQDNGLKMIAYGTTAKRTLETWLYVAKKLNQLPSEQFTTSTTEIPNMGKTSKTYFFYKTQNYIPFRSCYKRGIIFSENKSPVNSFDTEVGLQLILKEHISTFLRALGRDNQRFSFLLTQYPTQFHWVEAIKPKKDFNGKKPAFEILIATDLILPETFSLGQNVGTGNGIFRRVIS